MEQHNEVSNLNARSLFLSLLLVHFFIFLSSLHQHFSLHSLFHSQPPSLPSLFSSLLPNEFLYWECLGFSVLFNFNTILCLCKAFLHKRHKHQHFHVLSDNFSHTLHVHINIKKHKDINSKIKDYSFDCFLMDVLSFHLRLESDMFTSIQQHLVCLCTAAAVDSLAPRMVCEFASGGSHKPSMAKGCFAFQGETRFLMWVWVLKPLSQ